VHDPPDRRPLSVLHSTFEQLFGTVIDRVTLGRSLRSVVLEDRRGFSDFELAAFMRWIHRDPQRTRALHEAMEISAEISVSGVVDIADNALDSNMANTQISARKWTAEVYNRKRFGARTDVNVNQTIDIRAVMERASGRLIEHDGSADGG
jgi:hypothetical protein